MVNQLNQLTRNEYMIISNAQVEVSSAKPAARRRSIYLRNMDAANTITITFSDSQGTANNVGFPLRPFDFIIDSSQQDYECWQGAISAICSAASAVQNLVVVERYDV